MSAPFARSCVAGAGAWTGDAAGVVGTKARLAPPHLSVESVAGPEGAAGAVRFDLRFEVSSGRRGRGWSLRRRRGGGARLAGGAGDRSARGGRLGTAAVGWLGKHGERMAELLAAREADGRLAPHALPALGFLCDELDHPPPPGLDRLAPLPKGSKGSPRRPARPPSPGRCARISNRASTGSASCAGPGWAACSRTSLLAHVVSKHARPGAGRSANRRPAAGRAASFR